MRWVRHAGVVDPDRALKVRIVRANRSEQRQIEKKIDREKRKCLYAKRASNLKTPEQIEAKKEKARFYAARYYKNNRLSVLAYQSARQKRLRESDPTYREQKACWLRKWKEKNKEHCRARTRLWLKLNPDKRRKYRQAQRKKPHVKIVENLRARLRDLVKGKGVKKPSSKQSGFIGCSPMELRSHIERQWKRGMSWENYGQWHIDHIIPCAAFNLTEARHVSLCFHYSNLQPLWAQHNQSKSDALPLDSTLPLLLGVGRPPKEVS